MEKVISTEMERGDKIVLTSIVGPEGSKNIGIVERVKNTGVLANFGLKYHYLIPFYSIRTHLKQKVLESSMKEHILKEGKSNNQIKL